MTTNPLEQLGLVADLGLHDVVDLRCPVREGPCVRHAMVLSSHRGEQDTRLRQVRWPGASAHACYAMRPIRSRAFFSQARNCRPAPAGVARAGRSHPTSSSASSRCPSPCRRCTSATTNHNHEGTEQEQLALGHLLLHPGQSIVRATSPKPDNSAAPTTGRGAPLDGSIIRPRRGSGANRLVGATTAG